jgi:hypothetical protein
VPRDAELDGALPVASVAVPAAATLTQVGSLLVSTLTQYVESKTATPAGATYQTTINVYDLSDPTQPKQRGSLSTDRISPYYGGFIGSGGGRPALPPSAAGVAIDCFDCVPHPGVGGSSQYVAGDAIVFVSAKNQQESIGWVKRCYEYPTFPDCPVRSDMGCATPRYAGGISCVTHEGQAEQCTGELYVCDTSGSCAPPPAGTKIPTQKQCTEGVELRHWQSFGFDALDLRDPDQPRLADRLEMARDEEANSLHASGSALYFNFQKPHRESGDPRPYVKRFFRRIDFADPQAAAVGAAINVPGEVIADSGAEIFTRDFVWEDMDPRTLVARLEVDGDVARLQASRVFNQRSVNAVKLDGAGHVLASSAPTYSGAAVPVTSTRPGTPAEQPKHTLHILDAQSLELSGEADVDAWAKFTDARVGRALFAVSGGILVYNVEDPAKPFAQAYFPTLAWPNEILLDGRDALFAGGPYGIYRFDTDSVNLPMK